MTLQGGQEVADDQKVSVFELCLHGLLLRCSSAAWPCLWGRVWAGGGGVVPSLSLPLWCGASGLVHMPFL